MELKRPIESLQSRLPIQSSPDSGVTLAKKASSDWVSLAVKSLLKLGSSTSVPGAAVNAEPVMLKQVNNTRPRNTRAFVDRQKNCLGRLIPVTLYRQG